MVHAAGAPYRRAPREWREQQTMNGRQRIAAILAGEKPDRVGMNESPWSETMVRWRKEGLPEGMGVTDYFGMDFAHLGGFDVSFRFPVETLEKGEDYVVERNANGVTLKRFTHESGHTPHWLDHLLKGPADWHRHRDRLAFEANRVVANFVELAGNCRQTGRYVAVCHADPYEIAWPIFGQVGIFTLMMDDPAFVAGVFMTFADLLIECHEELRRRNADYDGVFMYTDLGYRNSTLFDPRLYDELLLPAHKKYAGYLRSRGKPLLCHSCGKIDVLIPRFIQAGFAAIQPLEAKCGQDIRELGKLYGGKIAFYGNIDVRKLSGTRADVKEEVVSKVEAAKRSGGYIFHSDHSVPPTVSWDNYRYAVDLVRRHGRY